MKLKYNYGNTTDTINLVTDPPSMHRLPIEKDGTTYYAKLGEINHPEASNLRVRRNGKTFAAIKNYNPLIFDECGNIWTKNNQNTDPGVVNGALVSAGVASRNYISGVPSGNFEFGGQDFTIEFIATFFIPSSTSGFKVIIGLYGTSLDEESGYRVWWSSNTYRTYFVGTQNDVTIFQINPKKHTSDGIPHHTAFCFDGTSNKVYLFIDGILNSTASADATLLRRISVSQLKITEFPGAIDEIRVSDGIARYTENFTPPTSFEVDEYTKVLMHF